MTLASGGRRRVVGAVVAALACAWPAIALAGKGPTVRVRFESEPPKANVYLNEIELGLICQTPCEYDVPVGESTAIFVLAGHVQDFLTIDVKRRGGKTPVFRKKLSPAIATLVLTGDTAKGAHIFIDEKDTGKVVPAELEVEATGHHVVYLQNGAKLYDDFVDLKPDQELTIAPKPKPIEVAQQPKPPDPEPKIEDDGDGRGRKPAVEKSVAVGRPRQDFVAVGARFDVGFRKFSYDGAMSPNVREESEGGQLLAGPVIELWPTRLFGMSFATGLSLYGRAEFGFHDQSVTGMNIGTLTTFWRSYEASARYRWLVADTAGLELGAGYVRDQLQFNGKQADIDMVPAADYQSIRAGVRVSLPTSSVEPYLEAENRIVLSGGPLGKRFATASTNGLHGALGVAWRGGPIAVRVEASVTNYGWDFTYDGSTATFKATGGSDRVTLISSFVSYQY